MGGKIRPTITTMKFKATAWLWLLLVHTLDATQDWQPRPYALVNPVAGTSHLQVAKEGLQFLESIDSPVAPIVVIGPYRSGKSFLLNQLLGVSCNEGFGVGHTRETETKGLWIWGQPKQVQEAQGEKMLLYVDTEGFESTGRSNTYDDRVFAVATVLSSLLVYNLPETIRGSDVSKLSFVVELAAGFYNKGDQVAVPVEPGSMLWVIQRDFLQGKSVQDLVNEALAPVPNPHNDKAIADTNTIRASLTSIAHNSTGYSLPQPHLDRTKLCELNDTQLDQRYVTQRDGLRTLVQERAKVKIVGGQQLTGKALAKLLQSLITALNAKEIPTGASLIESFNREIVSKALQLYVTQLDAAVKLPVEAEVLEQAHSTAQAAAEAAFLDQLLGKRQVDGLKAQLVKAIAKEHKAKVTANIAESNALCQALEMECTKQLVVGPGHIQLPSMFQFEGHHKACISRFETRCVGPARSKSQERLNISWQQARAQFVKDYNDKLLTGLMLSAVAAIVLFRFIVKVAVLEAVSWAAVIFLEVYPHIWGGSRAMYDSWWWKRTAQAWEGVMWLLFSAGGLALWVVIGLIAALVWRRLQLKQQARKKAVLTSRQGDVRDLDV